MRNAEGSADKFRVECGVRQGCVLSPLLFNWCIDRILRETWVSSPGGWNIDYTIDNLYIRMYRLSMIIPSARDSS